jgi:prepilin peptidase CpaA
LGQRLSCSTEVIRRFESGEMHANAAQAIWALTLTLTLYAAWVDGRTQRIPNWLTVAGLLTGLVIHLLLGGWQGLLTALEGAGLGLLILLPLVLLRALGAGDWKLMGAVGAFVGPVMLWFVLFASVMVAGTMAIISMIRARRVRETMRNVGLLIMGFLTFGFWEHPGISLDNPDALKLPFGVAAAIGTLICFVATNWHLVS